MENANKIHLLGNIPNSIDIEKIQKAHKNSILEIQKYITIANSKNK